MPAVALSLTWSSTPVKPDSSRRPRTPTNIDTVAEVDELVIRCQAGEPAAFRELFRNHKNDVARLIHRMLGHTSDLDDVIQEVFLQVHKSIKDFRGQARFSTWLYRVTVNVVLMHRRAARSRPMFVEAPESQVPSDRAPLPDEQVARRARIRAFNRLLDRLSEKKRTVFVLHELEGLSHEDIARLTRTSVGTTKAQLHRARQLLRRALA